MILKARAENGSLSSAWRSSSSIALDVHAPGGRDVDRGLGRKSTTASSMGWTPLFLKAEPHSTGTTWLAMVALRRARVRSSAVISSSPRNFSVMRSSKLDRVSIRVAR